MNVQLPKSVLDVVYKFLKNEHEIYIVGGAVRDILMGNTVVDWDFTTSATPEDIQSALGSESYYMGFGTVGYPTEDSRLKPFEITTFRTEHEYSDFRRPDKVEWGKTLEEDLQRRDFTINAMAFSIAQTKKLKNLKTKKQTSNEKHIGSGSVGSSEVSAMEEVGVEIIDPYNGQTDLENKIIRAVGDPTERFSEDALRMMRAIRIASQLGFMIEDETFEAIRVNAGLINKIAKERIKDELFKILASQDPYHGIVLLNESGLTDEILPEFVKTFGVEQKSPGRHHIYDVGTHSMYALKFVSERNEDPVTRFATLIHDIGKPQTYKKLETGVITFYNHEVVGGRIAKNIADRLRFSKKEKDKFYRLVRFHQFTVNEEQTDSAIRRFVRKITPEYVSDMLDLRVGDRLGGGARETSWRLEDFKKRLVEVQKQPFTVHDLKLKGDDVMNELGIGPGPTVGTILDKLYKDVVESKVQNEKEALLERLKRVKK
jgi:tRNA nucleotidyltransferase (CCA-adding enzyme)